jgi:hypothetical protein
MPGEMSARKYDKRGKNNQGSVEHNQQNARNKCRKRQLVIAQANCYMLRPQSTTFAYLMQRVYTCACEIPIKSLGKRMR